MSNLHHKPAFIWQGFLLLMFVSLPVLSADYSNIISEDYLRSEFTFGPGDKLKYSKCKKMTYPACTYVWGAESKKDAARKKYGLAPDGNKLQVIYARAKSPEDFQRVLASYSDADKVDGIGTEAVWSEKRKQLSFITKENLIVHINIDEKGGGNPRGKAVSIAKNILDQI